MKLTELHELLTRQQL